MQQVEAARRNQRRRVAAGVQGVGQVEEGGEEEGERAVAVVSTGGVILRWRDDAKTLSPRPGTSALNANPVNKLNPD